jgi:lambda family phage minor tail protein L
MTIEQDALKAALPHRIELFEIDATMIEGLATTYYLTNNQTSVNFGGLTYTPYPIAISGIQQTSDGAPPRPVLSISNINKIIGTLAFLYNDIVGAKVSYIETFSTYLNTGSRISAPPLKYEIRRKPTHNKIGLTFELRSALDNERSYLPRRQMLKRDFPGLGINKWIK